MFCDFCIAVKVPSDKTAFINGVSNFRLETIKYHEASNSHLFAVQKHAHEQNPTEAPVYRAKLSLNKAIYARLSIIFKTVHAINIQGRPA